MSAVRFLSDPAASRTPRPFLKWAGGKAQLLEQIYNRLPATLTGSGNYRYIEPFLGGGAVYFMLARLAPPREAFLIDINADLVNAYKVVQRYPAELVGELKNLQQDYVPADPELRATLFYSVRERYNASKRRVGKAVDIGLARDLIFLNRTCFNGLYRENRAGFFNVPHGKYSRPLIVDEDNIFAVSRSLQKAEILVGDFRSTMEFVASNTFIYFDPPYRPITPTASFVAYSSGGFTDKDQIELAHLYRKISRRYKSSRLMLSNSDAGGEREADPFYREHYRGFEIHRVQASRAINSKGHGRGPVSEVIVTNY